MQTFYKIVFGFFVFCFIYSLATKPFRNPFKLRFIFGKKGSGKSTYLTMIGYKYLKKGWDVYTNMEDCYLPGVKIIDAADFGQFMPAKNSVVLFDEASTYWDARDFKSFSPETRNAFVYSRHQKLIIYVASQTYNVDKKVRDLTDEMLLLQNVATIFTLIRPIKKTVGLSEANEERESTVVENLKFKSIFSWKLLFIPKYAKYFDSYVTADIPEIPFVQR